MNGWNQLDELVAKHDAQIKGLRSLAKEGGVFRRPRFTPPCVWTLIYGARSPLRGQKVITTSYDEAKAALEVDALRMRAHRAAVAKAKEEERAAKAAKKKGGRSR